VPGKLTSSFLRRFCVRVEAKAGGAATAHTRKQAAGRGKKSLQHLPDDGAKALRWFLQIISQERQSLKHLPRM